MPTPRQTSVGLLLLVAVLGLANSGSSSDEAGTQQFPRGTVPPVSADWYGWKLKLRDSRYNAFLSHIQFHLLPNFTTTGYQLVEGPKHLFEKMRANFEANHEAAGIESPGGVVTHLEKPPTFIRQDDTNAQVLQELQAAHEEWAGVPLVPSAAYGLRVYHNTSILKWHVDRVETHVVSCIFHIASELDEPWPLVIVNNTGHLNAVSLQPGQMLFYESARLRHARPNPMKGRYYTSLFVHYRPQGWDFKDGELFPKLPQDWDRDTILDVDKTDTLESLEREVHRDEL